LPIAAAPARQTSTPKARRRNAPVLPRPEDEPTLTVERTAKVLGIGKSSAYAAVSRGEIPVIRVGGRLLVPTAALRRLLGIDEVPVAAAEGAR
jgi:excisionase family DNA binding protein